MYTRKNRAFLKLLMLLSLTIYSCATFNPRPIKDIPFRERAQSQYEDNIRVTAVVLSAEESEALFGLPLYRRGIQPVWLEIENKDEQPVWFLPVSLDPDYFAPLEVAYMHRSTFSSKANRKMEQYFHNQGIRGRIAPGDVRSGFVFTNLDKGTKAFNVDLVGEDHRVRMFTFFISVPGLKESHRDVDWHALYSEDELSLYGNEGDLKKALERLPCCATNQDGTKQGDPVNLVIIGSGRFLYRALIRRGWDETEALASSLKTDTGTSSFTERQSRYGPVSPLYLFGRAHDAAFRKTRKPAEERNHLRLWLSPILYNGQTVWIGQISRNIKVRYLPNTYKLEPLVDEARTYILQDLWYSQGLEKYGYVNGVGAAPMSEPRSNFKGDTYFTDGYRLVMWVSGRSISFSDVEVVPWYMPSEISSD